ncbi:virion structural protein [Ralstonia phage PQ43W]
MAGTLTVANSSIQMTTEALYTTAQRLQGYATDDAFTTEAVENGEYYMGIDGKLSAGFVFNEIPLTLTFQADSDSLLLFENIWQYEVTNRTKLGQAITIAIPDLKRRYDFTQGFMRSYKAPEGKKILQPAVVAFVFGRMKASPL